MKTKRIRRTQRDLAPMQTPSACLCCGAENPWVITAVDFVAPFRNTEHSFIVNVNQCRKCGEISPCAVQTEDISIMVRDAHKNWISQELGEVRAALGLSIDVLAAKTGIPRATLARASCRESLIDATTEKLLWSEIEALRHRQVIDKWTQMQPSSLDFSREIEVIHHVGSRVVNLCNYLPFLSKGAQSPLAQVHRDNQDVLSTEFCPIYA